MTWPTLGLEEDYQGRMQELETGVYQEAREKHCALWAPGTEQRAGSHIPL